MGIERFFKSINSLYSNQIIKNIHQNNSITHFYFDFNSVIHKISNKVINHLNDMLLFSLVYKYSDQSGMDRDIVQEDFNKINEIYNLKYSIEEFYKVTKNINTNDIIFNLIFKDIKNYLSFYPNCKFLYIAIDGVPSVGKMIEQQDRRYKGYIMSLINKKIKEKYKYLLDNNSFDFTNIYNEYEYLELKFSFDKNLISPQTDFMIDFINLLKKQDFNMKTIISDFDEVGEGEKKIVKYIKKFNSDKDKIIIYSPDADMIIMSMILPFHIHILRHEQNDNRDDIIDIQSIRQYFTPVDDIAYIFSVFGDDFIPKIEWINVQKHLPKIIEEYKKMGVKIIENNSVNLKNLQKFFNQIKKLENDFTPSKNRFDDFIQVVNYKSFKYYNEINNVEKLIREYTPKFQINEKHIPPLDYYLAMKWKFIYYFQDDESQNNFYYKYDKSPTIDDLISFNEFDKVQLNFKTTELLPIDQLCFISPTNVSKYVDKQKINKEIAEKLYKLMKIEIPEIKIINDKINIDEIFDCENARYLNKCHLKFNIITFEKFKTVI
jgi:5'-3' exonuclease